MVKNTENFSMPKWQHIFEFFLTNVFFVGKVLLTFVIADLFLRQQQRRGRYATYFLQTEKNRRTSKQESLNLKINHDLVNFFKST